MKLSDILNWANTGDTALRWFEKIPGWVSAIQGGNIPNDAPNFVKGLHGIFGHGDEREFQLLLIVLEKKLEGSRSAIEGFIEWHFFSGDNTPLEKTLRWWYANAFRAFITKMSVTSEVADLGTKKTIDKSTVDGVERTEETIEKLRASNSNNSIDFLHWMAKTILDAPTREEGYQTVLRSFKNSNVPHMPDYDLQRLFVFGQNTKDVVRALEQSFITYSQSIAAKAAERRARPKSFLERLLVDWKL